MKDIILHGNCIETLKTIPDGSVDCCITSPPYYDFEDYGEEGEGIIHECHCENCGARITYRVPNELPQTLTGV